MPTLAEIDAEIARRSAPQESVAPAVQQVAPDIAAIDAEIAKRSRPLASPSPLAEESRAVKELPELGAGALFKEGDGTGFGDRAKAAIATMFTPDPEELAKILGSIPEIGITRTPQGDLIANNNQTGQQVVINKPELSQLDLIQGLSIGAAFLPAAFAAPAIGAAFLPASIAAPAIGTAAGLGGLGATVAGGVTGSVLTQTAIEGLQASLGGEISLKEIAKAGAFGGAGELVWPAIQAVRNVRGAKPTSAEVVAAKNVSEAKPAAQQTGIDLFAPQQTLNKADLDAMSFVPELPAATIKTTAKLKKQNQQAGDAVEDFLSQIAPETAVSTGPRNFKTAAERAVEVTKNNRDAMAGPVYRAAFKEGGDVNIAPINSLIDNILADLPDAGQSFSVLNKAKKLISPTGREGAKGNLKRMQEAKIEIDDMINGVGNKPIGNMAQGRLLAVKKKIIKEMGKVSQKYVKANKVFSDASLPVDEITESIIGQVAKTKETNLKNISTKIFSPTETRPQIIRDAKKAINDVDPNAWNELFRSEIERRLGSAKVEGASASIPNTPGKLLTSIFGNDKSRKVLYAAADGEVKKNLRFLETALKRAAVGRPGGSQTAGRQEAIAELKGGIGNTMFTWLSRPFKTFGKVMTQKAFDKRVKILSSRLFETEYRAEMANIRRLGNTKAGAQAMVQLLSKQTAEETAGESIKDE